MNIANLISLSRIVFGFLGIVALLKDQPLLFLLFLLVGVISDFLDGKVAKWQKTNSGRGKLLDLFCDQIFEGTLAIGLFCIHELPLYYFLILLLRIGVSIGILLKNLDEFKKSPGKMELRIHSLLTLVVLFFFGFALAIKSDAPPLAEGLLKIALPFVLMPIAALMEGMTSMKLISQFFDQRG
ncbi:MAG: CDP-alcohol phosphatidyltransferase family protein [Halobacteriovoraceae bacterium]|nr:CDP-alcohol phosphatidyltransferase family protein [Halobacteriovoraceae bacterium]